jgi:hypothetical protein
MMRKWTFKQWYAIAVLLVVIVYGWLYLTENRYILNTNGDVFDTWTKKYKPISDIIQYNL